MDPVTIDRRPPVRWVRLDTGKRNVLVREAVEALTEAIGEDAEAPVVVLRGRKDGFCCGLDNATLARGGAARDELFAAMAELLLETFRGPSRIVAVCEGHAVAAGAMLLLTADVRIGVPGSYKVGFTEPRLGMPLPELPAILARERLDRRRMHELTALGRTVDGEGAAAVGFLDRLVGEDALEAAALEAANDLAALSDAAYRGSLASVRGPTIERIEAMVETQVRRRDAARAAAT